MYMKKFPIKKNKNNKSKGLYKFVGPYDRRRPIPF